MIDITIEKNPELYSMPISNCLEFLKTIDDNLEIITEEKIKFHAYWHVGRKFERKQILPIKSYLATQDLTKTEFILWSNIDLSDNEYIKPYLPYITIKIYNPVKESIGTVLEERNDILLTTDNICYSNSDLFRVLILHKYGGVYIDMDIVLLRNFSPLMDQEFMYMWGFLPNNNSGINGAVMRLFKKSKLSDDLLTEIKNGPIVPGSTIWDNPLYCKVRNYNKDWCVLPSALFNSEWQDDPNQNWGSAENNSFGDNPYKLYESAFAWHWHNRWDNDIHPNSKWKKVEDIIEDKLRKKLNIT